MPRNIESQPDHKDEINENTSEAIPREEKPHGADVSKQEDLEFDLERLMQLDEKLDARRLMTSEVKDKGKVKEITYRESEEGKNDLAEIEELLQKHGNKPLFKEYMIKRAETIKTEREEILAIKEQLMEMEIAKNKIRKGEYPENYKKPFIDENPAINRMLSPEELQEIRNIDEQRRMDIEKSKEESNVEPSKTWWKFWQ